MHRLSLLGTSAVLAASLLAAPGPAKAQTVNYIGADLAYTVNGSGTSTASGTSALNTALVGVTSTGNLNTVRNGIGNYPEDYGLTSPGGTAYGVTGTQALGFEVGNPNANRAEQWGVTSATFTLPTAESYFGALINTWNTDTTSIAFYNGSTLLGSINTTGIGTVGASIGTEWWSTTAGKSFYLNVDFLGGVTYNEVVLTENYDSIYTGAPVVSAAPVSLTDMTSDSAPGPVPLPALAGTIPGMLIALGGTARRRRHAV
jgi:hypothetical protein